MDVKKLGFLQAIGVIFYCSLVGILFWQGPRLFPRINPYFGPVMFLLVFSTSVLICGLIVFYKPYKLFLANKRKDALDVVVFTSLWLLFFLFFFFLFMVLLP